MCPAQFGRKLVFGTTGKWPRRDRDDTSVRLETETITLAYKRVLTRSKYTLKRKFLMQAVCVFDIAGLGEIGENFLSVTTLCYLWRYFVICACAVVDFRLEISLKR